jgi:hypothetical protein
MVIIINKKTSKSFDLQFFDVFWIILHFWISVWSGFRITLNSSGIITEGTLGVNNHQAENPYSIAFSSSITNWIPENVSG